jgi:hypothetical protein
MGQLPFFFSFFFFLFFFFKPSKVAYDGTILGDIHGNPLLAADSRVGVQPARE